ARRNRGPPASRSVWKSRISDMAGYASSGYPPSRHSATRAAMSSWRWLTALGSRVIFGLEQYAGTAVGTRTGQSLTDSAPRSAADGALCVLDQLAEVCLQGVHLAVLLEPLLGLSGGQDGDPLARAAGVTGHRGVERPGVSPAGQEPGALRGVVEPLREVLDVA